MCVFLNTDAQITTDSNPPYNSPIYLVDSLLLGEGVFATNHIFQGDPLQIGFFNGENSNIGLDSGIVMGTGDISELIPGFFGGAIINAVDDQDLLDVANSVPGLIGQNFNLSSVNDVAILEFDFIPVSSTYPLSMCLPQLSILDLKTLILMMFLDSLFQGLIFQDLILVLLNIQMEV